jgi:hypothetical protein
MQTAAQAGDGSDSFQIFTQPDGFNSGRCYYLKAESVQECEMMVETLQRMIGIAKARAEGNSRFQRSQQIARRVYDSTTFQLLSCLLIILVISKRPFASPEIKRTIDSLN